MYAVSKYLLAYFLCKQASKLTCTIGGWGVGILGRKFGRIDRPTIDGYFMSPWDFPLPAVAHRISLSARASTTPTPWDRGVMRAIEKMKTMDTSTLASNSAPARRTADLSKRFTIRQATPRASHSSVSLSSQGAPLTARSSELLSQDEDDAIWAHITQLEAEGKDVAAAALTARLLERHHKRHVAEASRTAPPPKSTSIGGGWYRAMVAQACESELARELARHAEVEAAAAAVPASAMATASAAAKDAVAEAAAAVAASAAAVQAAADATAAEAAAASVLAVNRGVPLLPLPEDGEAGAVTAAVTGSGRSGDSNGSRGLPTATGPAMGVTTTKYSAAGGTLQAASGRSTTKIGKCLRQPASRNLRPFLKKVPALSGDREWWALRASLRRAAPPQARV